MEIVEKVNSIFTYVVSVKKTYCDSVRLVSNPIGRNIKDVDRKFDYLWLRFCLKI